MMADVYCGNPTAYDPVSREKMVWDIYDLVRPLDSWTPNTATLLNPGEIKVAVVDPVVIKVDWYLDGKAVARDGGASFNPFNFLTQPGEYIVKAHAYDYVVTRAYSDRGGDSLGKPGSKPSDSLDWVRKNLDKLQQDVSWKINVTSTRLEGTPAGQGVSPRVIRADDRTLEVYFPGAGRYSLETLSLHGTVLATLSGEARANAVRIPWQGLRHTGINLIRIRHAGKTLILKWAGPGLAGPDQG
jgi:hypothetical protein